MSTPQTKFADYLEKLAVFQSVTDFYDYEKLFSQIHTEFGREMLEHHVSEQSTTTEKKGYKKSPN